MTAREWLDAYAESLGVPAPSDADVDSLLALAGVAAHASERIAAPIACWLTARAGLDPQTALGRAREIAGDG